MADPRQTRVNLISFLGLLAIVALLWVTPEVRELAGGVRQSLRERLQREETAESRPESTPEEPAPGPVKGELPAAPAETPLPPHVYLSDSKTYLPEPGYTWVNSDPGNLDVKWTPGVRHRDHPNVIAAQEQDQWHPAAGYGWVEPNVPEDLRVEWKPGAKHPAHEHVIAAQEEGHWQPEAGYNWIDPDSPEDLRVAPLPSGTPPPSP